MSENDRIASHVREHLDAHGVLSINLMSSPGSGKTQLLEATIAALPKAPGRRKLGPIHYVVGALGILVCIWAASQADAKAWLTLGALAAGGLILFILASVRSAPEGR